MKDNPYMTLAKFILPGEMTEYFDLTKVESDWLVTNNVFIFTLTRSILSLRVHRMLYLMDSTKNRVLTTFLYASIVPYSMCVVASGRIWKARAYQKTGIWLPKAPATQRSLRLFKKNSLDTSPITARSLQKPYHIKADEFGRAYKDYLSDFRTWKHQSHTQKWLIFPRNMVANLSIDETAFTNGDLYTIISNKDAHGRKGALLAIVSGTKVEDVVAAIQKIHWYLRCKVREVTMDFSEGMRQIVLECFPNATITLDRFHMQQLVSDAMQELRLKHKKEEQKFLNEQRKLFNEQLKEKYERSLKRRKKNKKDKRGRKPIRMNKAFVPERLSNGDTIPELLSRIRYPLMVSGEKWTTTQKERISLLFERYPDLKEAYSIVHSLRMIFSNTKSTWISAYESMQKWYDKVKAFANDSFNTAPTLYVTGKMKYSTILSTVQQMRLPSLSTQR